MTNQIDPPILPNEAAYLAEQLSKLPAEEWPQFIEEHEHKLKAMLTVRPANTNMEPIPIMQTIDDSCIILAIDEVSNHVLLLAMDSIQNGINAILNSLEQNEVH